MQDKNHFIEIIMIDKFKHRQSMSFTFSNNNKSLDRFYIHRSLVSLACMDSSCISSISSMPFLFNINSQQWTLNWLLLRSDVIPYFKIFTKKSIHNKKIFPKLNICVIVCVSMWNFFWLWMEDSSCSSYP